MQAAGVRAGMLLSAIDGRRTSCFEFGRAPTLLTNRDPFCELTFTWPSEPRDELLPADELEWFDEDSAGVEPPPPRRLLCTLPGCLIRLQRGQLFCCPDHEYADDARRRAQGAPQCARSQCRRPALEPRPPAAGSTDAPTYAEYYCLNCKVLDDEAEAHANSMQLAAATSHVATGVVVACATVASVMWLAALVACVAARIRSWGGDRSHVHSDEASSSRNGYGAKPRPAPLKLPPERAEALAVEKSTTSLHPNGSAARRNPGFTPRNIGGCTPWTFKNRRS